MSVEEARERARQWRQRWKYEPGSMLEIHLAEPEALIDALADENERLQEALAGNLADAGLALVPNERDVARLSEAVRSLAEGIDEQRERAEQAESELTQAHANIDQLQAALKRDEGVRAEAATLRQALEQIMTADVWAAKDIAAVALAVLGSAAGSPD